MYMCYISTYSLSNTCLGLPVNNLENDIVGVHFHKTRMIISRYGISTISKCYSKTSISPYKINRFLQTKVF